MTAAVFTYAAAFGMYNQFIGVYALSLGASRFMVGALTSVMYGVWALSMIPGAWAATRFPLRWVVVLVWWLTVPAALCFAAAPSWPWLIPALAISGLYMANNPAMKVYIQLKADPSRLAGTMSIIFGTNSAGFILAPMIGGHLADRFGIRAVFVIAAAVFAVSSTLVTFIRHAPYVPEGGAPRPREIWGNRSFRRYLSFFSLGFLAVFVAQPFVSPYLAQVHGQTYAALGVFAALASLGATVLSPSAGRVADRWGTRAGIGLLLCLTTLGVLALLFGPGPIAWGLAMLFCGGFDAFRYVAYGVCSRSFGALERAWGYGVFDAVMGLPMVGGALLGGLLYRLSYHLPFVAAAIIGATLVTALAVRTGGHPRTVRDRRETWDSSTI